MPQNSDRSQIREGSKLAIAPFRLCIKKGRLVLQQHKGALVSMGISQTIEPSPGYMADMLKVQTASKLLLLLDHERLPKATTTTIQHLRRMGAPLLQYQSFESISISMAVPEIVPKLRGLWLTG